MDLVKLFVYGTLMYDNSIEKLCGNSVKVLEKVPAFIEGKLYDGGRFPIVIKKNEGRKARAPVIVHGALLTLEISEEGWKCLDAYEGCSKSTLLKNAPSDLYHRVIVKARTIHYDSIQQFIEMKYTTGEPVDCQVYLRNMKHEFISYRCTQLRRKNGIVWRNYFNVFS
jgi:gamma-glutamylcyclotransferase (GGCT)/AIG2-like uncharacterized protein YtfP